MTPDIHVDKHLTQDKQGAAPFERSQAADNSFGHVNVKKEDLRLRLDEEVTGDVHFGTFNKKHTDTSDRESMKIEKIDSSQKDGPTKTEKLEKGAMKKAIDLHLM